jgi:hypothetical protein
MTASLRFASLFTLALAACTSSTPPTDGDPVSCTSSRAQTDDPDCPAAPNHVIAFASFHPTIGAAHGLPTARFPTPIENVFLEREVVAIDSCGSVESAVPPCVCDAGQFCHPDGSCHPTPFVGNRDVGPVELFVAGVSVGVLESRGIAYEPTGELAQRLDAIWTGGEQVRAENAELAGFAIEVTAPDVFEVTSFAHTLAPQLAPLDEDLALTWTPGDADEVLEIAFGTATSYVRCVATDDGSFALPWPLIRGTFEIGAGEFFVFVDRTRRVVGPSEVGPVELILRASDIQGFAFVAP